MNYETLPYHPPGSDEWKAQRRTGVGSSDAPVLCLGEWFGRSALETWLSKVHGHEPEVNNDMRMGSVMEDTIARIAAEQEGWTIRTIPTIRSVEFPWQLANLDRVITGLEVPLEIKKARFGRDWGRGREDVPVGYYFQVQHQMAVFGANRCFLAVLIGGADLRVYEIEARPEIQARIRQVEFGFWTHVLDRTPPPVRSDVGDLLDRYFKPDVGLERTAEAGDPVAALVAKWQAAGHTTLLAGRAQRAADKVKKAAAAELKMAMAGHGRIHLPGGGYVEQTPAKKAGRFDLKLVGVQLPEEDDDGDDE